MKKIAIAGLFLGLSTLPLAAQANQPVNISVGTVDSEGIKLTDFQGHQPILVTIEDNRPSNFTVNYGHSVNEGVDKTRPTFVVHIDAARTGPCGDFRGVALPKPVRNGYQLTFDLRQRYYALVRSMRRYGCAVVDKPSVIKP